MAYVAPHFGNLKARATKLGLIITKTTTAEDARIYGGHNYVLHAPGADWENMEMLALGGIRHEIELAEKRVADKAERAKELARYTLLAAASDKPVSDMLDIPADIAEDIDAANWTAGIGLKDTAGRRARFRNLRAAAEAKAAEDALMSEHLKETEAAAYNGGNGNDSSLYTRGAGRAHGLVICWDGGFTYYKAADFDARRYDATISRAEADQVARGYFFDEPAAPAKVDRANVFYGLGYGPDVFMSVAERFEMVRGKRAARLHKACPDDASAAFYIAYQNAREALHSGFQAHAWRIRAREDSATIEAAATECAAIAERDILPIAKSRLSAAQTAALYEQAGNLPSRADMLSPDDSDPVAKQRTALLTVAALLDDWPTMRALSALGAQKATANKDAARRAVAAALGNIGAAGLFPEPMKLEFLPPVFNVELGDGYPHPYPNHLPEVEQDEINENAACKRFILQGVRSFEWRFTLTIEFRDRAAYDAAQTATGWKTWDEGRFILEAVTDASAGREIPAIIVGGRAYNQLFIRFPSNIH